MAIFLSSEDAQMVLTVIQIPMQLTWIKLLRQMGGQTLTRL